MTTPALRVDALAWYPYSKKVHDAFLDVIPEMHQPLDPLVVLQNTRGQEQMLGVPRELAVVGPDTEDNRSDGEEISPIGLNPKFPPRNDEQRRMIVESHGHLLQHRSHIIQASTGVGKTFVGLNIAAQSELKTLVIVTKNDLMERWREDALKFTDLTADDIGVIQQKKCEVVGKKLCFAMMHSLVSGKYPPEIWREFGLAIWDEVHHVSADTFQRSAQMIPARYRLGLSATVSRSDGKEYLIHAHIGPVLIESKFIPLKLKVLAHETEFRLPRVPRKVRGEWRNIPLPHEAGRMGHVTKMLAGDMERNRLIVDFIIAAYNKGRFGVALSDLARENHLFLIAKMLTDRGVPADAIGYYVGGMKKAELEETKSRRIVLGTYAMASEGTDVPHWSYLVMLTPRANILQSIGRILRQHPNKPQPVVLDLIDRDSEVCVAYFNKRLRQYRSDEIGAEVKLFDK